MSIATDVSRIKGNITAALAAIADKGVTVPDGSTSDALAGLIASIEAGGGSGVKIASGTIVLSEPASQVEFVHDFGEDVNFFAIFTSESSATSSTGLFCALISRNRCVIARNNSSGSKVINITTGTNTGKSPSDMTDIIGPKSTSKRQYNIWADDNKLVIDGFMEDGMSCRLKDGVEYMWFATTWSEV